MSDRPTNFEELIRDWGIAEFAAAIGVTYSTANAMKQRNRVPAKHWPQMIEAAPKKFGLTPAAVIALQAKAGKVAA